MANAWDQILRPKAQASVNTAPRWQGSTALDWNSIKQGQNPGGAGIVPFSQGAKSIGGQAIGTGIGALLGNPFIGWLAGQAGSYLLGNVFGGGESPYEKALKQMTNSGLIGDLQKQASGQPTATTNAMMRQLRGQVGQMQQAYGAQASQAMPGSHNTGMTTPERAQQGRYQSALVEGQANILGQAQQQAQAYLTQLYGGALTAVGQLEDQENSARAEMGGYLTDMLKSLTTGQDTTKQNMTKQIADKLLKLFDETGGQQGGSNVDPATIIQELIKGLDNTGEQQSMGGWYTKGYPYNPGDYIEIPRTIPENPGDYIEMPKSRQWPVPK